MTVQGGAGGSGQNVGCLLDTADQPWYWLGVRKKRSRDPLRVLAQVLVWCTEIGAEQESDREEEGVRFWILGPLGT